MTNLNNPTFKWLDNSKKNCRECQTGERKRWPQDVSLKMQTESKNTEKCISWKSNHKKAGVTTLLSDKH